RQGENSRICFSSRSILLPAASAVTSISLFSLTTSRVCVPMEPVEPSMAIFFISIFLPAKRFSLSDHGCQIIDHRRRKDDAVKPVQDTAVSRDQLSIIFHVVIALDG